MAAQRTLYWGSGSTFAWRVLIALKEKGLDFESKVIEFSKSESLAVIESGKYRHGFGDLARQTAKQRNFVKIPEHQFITHCCMLRCRGPQVGRGTEAEPQGPGANLRGRWRSCE